MKFRETICIIIILFGIQLPVHSQDKNDKRSVGISATIQDNQFGILLPIWVSKMTVIAPSFDIKYAEKIGTEYSIGIVPKFYLKKTEKATPYIALKFGEIISSPSSQNQASTKKTTDMVTGVAFGGEYFFDKQFSIGLELQGNLTISDNNSDRFGNPGGTNFNTATMVLANIYF